MSEREKVTVDDIIGIVKCEQTDSVEEVRKLRGRTNERFIVDTAGTLVDMVTRDTFDYVSDVVGLLNGYDKENEQLKKDCTVLIYHNQEYRKENEQLKAQLYCDSEEGVCSICKHHYLEKGNIFYISKCEKGHEKCSKESVRHCEDFKLKELQE